MNLLVGKRLIVLFVSSFLIVGCDTQQNKSEESAKVKLDFANQDIEAAYSIGHSVGNNLATNLKNLEELKLNVSHEVITQGFIDGLGGHSDLDDEALTKAMKSFETRVRGLVEEKEKQLLLEAEEVTATYLKENAAKEGVVTLPSGLQYKILTAAEGEKPGPTDKVKVHYSGTLTDGTKFDSSYDRNMPATFVVGGVIKGWTEALQLMSVGEKWQLTIPGNLAYGEQGRPGTIPPNATLLFDVELLEINPAVAAPKTEQQ